jgi:hypothetical protein
LWLQPGRVLLLLQEHPWELLRSRDLLGRNH